MLTRYPVISPAYFPSGSVRDPQKTQVNGGAGFLVRTSRIHFHAGSVTVFPFFSYCIVIWSGGPCGGIHFCVASEKLSGDPGFSPSANSAKCKSDGFTSDRIIAS